MTWDEFEDLTFAQLEAIENRRIVRINHSRYNAGLVAAMIFNANAGADSDKIDAFDFVPGFQRTAEEIEEEKRVTSIKQGVRVAFSRLGYCSPEKLKKHRAGMLKRLQDSGIADAEEFITEVFGQ